MTTQPLSAPAEAHAVRRERAALQRKLAETRPRGAAIGSGIAVLAAPGPRVAGMSIRELLVALYGVGPIRARDVLETTRIDPATSLAELTGKHRRRLTRALAELIGPRPDQRGARRRGAGARQVGAPGARDVAGDVLGSGGATDQMESP
jgi:ribosomal protein S13